MEQRHVGCDGCFSSPERNPKPSCFPSSLHQGGMLADPRPQDSCGRLEIKGELQKSHVDKEFQSLLYISALPSTEPGPWQCCRSALWLPASDSSHTTKTMPSLAIRSQIFHYIFLLFHPEQVPLVQGCNESPPAPPTLPALITLNH